MSNEKKFEAKFTVKDEASQKINSFRQQIKSLNTETKYQLKPLLDLRQTWGKVGLVWGVAAGAAAVTINQLTQMREEFKKLDELAIKFGISTEELSKRMYGFNIATDKARIGVSWYLRSIEDIKEVARYIKTSFAELPAEAAINAEMGRMEDSLIRDATKSKRQKNPFVPSVLGTDEIARIKSQVTRAEAIKNLLGQIEAEKAKLPEAQVSNNELELKTKQLLFSDFKYKKDLLENEVLIYRNSGADKIKVAEYESAAKKRIDDDRDLAFKQQQVIRLKAEGRTIDAMVKEQEVAAAKFERTWGTDSKMVNEFKAGQKAILDNARLTMLGLKNNAQIWADGQKEIISGMSTTWESFFSDAFHGDLKKGSEYFRMFGESIIQTWSKMMAEMVTRSIWAQGAMQGSSGSGGSGVMSWIKLLFAVTPALQGIGTVTGGAGGQMVNTGAQSVAGHDFTTAWTPYHRGGIVRAHSGLAVDEVPIIAQRGERVLSRKQNEEYEKGLGGVHITMNVQIDAIDDLSFRQKLSQHPDIYKDALSNGIMRSEAIRHVIKKYASR